MIHHRQRLPFGLEAGDHLFRVHPQLDDLERHPPAHRLGLFGHIDHPAAALADLLHQLVAVYGVAGLLRFARRRSQGRFRGWLRSCGQFREESPRRRVGLQKFFDLPAQQSIPHAGPIEIECPFLSWQPSRRTKDDGFPQRCRVHRLIQSLLFQGPLRSPLINAKFRGELRKLFFLIANSH